MTVSMLSLPLGTVQMSIPTEALIASQPLSRILSIHRFDPHSDPGGEHADGSHFREEVKTLAPSLRDKRLMRAVWEPAPLFCGFTADGQALHHSCQNGPRR